MFTPKEASEILEIPPSTLRRYRSKWADYLSAPDNKRRYTQEDIDTLRLIRDLTNRRKSTDDIIAALQEPIEPFIFEDTQPEQETQGAIQSIEFFSQIIDQLTEEHKTALQSKDQTIEILLTENERLRAELEKKNRGFWDRITGRRSQK